MVRTALQQDLDKAGDTWNEELWIHELVRSHRRRKRLTKPKYKYMHMLQNHVYELLNTGERLKTRDDSEVPSPRRESSKMLQRRQSPPPTPPPTTPPPLPPTGLHDEQGPDSIDSKKSGVRQPGVSSSSGQRPGVGDTSRQ